MIFVDQLTPCPQSRTWHNNEACWLMADPANGNAASCLEALQTFAESLCISRSWLRKSAEGMPYYTLSPRRRAYAVAKGAHQANRLRAQQIIERWRVLMLPPITTHSAR